MTCIFISVGELKLVLKHQLLIYYHDFQGEKGDMWILPLDLYFQFLAVERTALSARMGRVKISAGLTRRKGEEGWKRTRCKKALRRNSQRGDPQSGSHLMVTRLKYFQRWHKGKWYTPSYIDYGGRKTGSLDFFTLSSRQHQNHQMIHKIKTYE